MDALLDPAVLDLSPGPTVIAVTRVQPMERVTARHSHGRGQLLGALDGLLSIETDVARYAVPAVSAVWIPPHVVHGLRSHGPFRGWSVYVAEAACIELPGEPTTLRPSGLLREAVKRACRWRGVRRSPADERIAAVICDEIARAERETVALPMPTDPRLRRIANALLHTPSDARGLVEWGHWAGVAPRTLTRLFPKETGFDFRAWRQRARILRALELLAEGTQVTTAGLEVGYETVSAFIAAFRATLGATPARYAKRLHA
jgi:AraC-like DNA-binding protein